MQNRKAGSEFGGAYLKGQITVFMALTMTLIFSVVLGAVEAVRINTVRFLAQTASELAVGSALAEYNIPLYERYGIFAVDGNRENLTGDILSYARRNESEGFFKFKAGQMYISEVTTLSDMGYKPMEKEIVQYMKASLGEEAIEALSDTVEGTLLDKAQQDKTQLGWAIATEEAASKAAAGEAAQNESSNTASSENGEKTEYGSGHPAETIKDPRKSLRTILKDGLLGCVLPNDMEVSESALDEVLNQGNGIIWCPEIKDFDRAESVTDFLDSFNLSAVYEDGVSDLSTGLIVNEYILKHFKQAVLKEGSVDFDTQLQYENEYIICGHMSDRDNLLDMLNRIALLRTAFNTAYLFSDAVKRAEAHTVAASVTALVPFLEPLVYVLIMAAWGYAEGIMDIRALMDGKKVPLLKNSMNWKLSLRSLSDGRLEGGSEDERGLSYEGYLRIFLMLTAGQKKYERMENLMQANIRLIDGYENFNIRQCYYGMTCLFEYTMPSYFSVYPKSGGEYTMNYQWSECY